MLRKPYGARRARCPAGGYFSEPSLNFFQRKISDLFLGEKSRPRRHQAFCRLRTFFKASPAGRAERVPERSIPRWGMRACFCAKSETLCEKFFLILHSGKLLITCTIHYSRKYSRSYRKSYFLKLFNAVSLVL